MGGGSARKQWVAPPSWPQPEPGWSPRPGWQPDPAWGPAPAGWQWWQDVPRAHPPFWKARTVADTSPRFRRRLGATFGALALLFVIGAVGDDSETDLDAERVAVADVVSPSPETSSPASEPPSPTPAAAAAPSPTAVVPPTTDEVLARAQQSGDGSALALLAALEVKGRAAKTGYDRDLFGQAWADTDRNGCDTRNDILGRDLTGVTYKAGTGNCKVLAGILDEPFTGRTITFSSGDASAVQIDHVVALSDAWQKGAQQWEPGKRLAFANDPLNLLAVHGPSNASKSDSDAATWLPPDRSYWCPMVARQAAVKAKYGVAVTAAERDAMVRVLSACPGEPVPTSPAPTIAPISPPPAAPQPAAPAPPPPAPAPAGGTDPDYGTCKQAKANGKGPYVQGRDPEYDWYRDADGDGQVCE